MAETYNSTIRRDKAEDPLEKEARRRELLPRTAIDGRSPQSASDATPSGIAKRKSQQAAAGVIGTPGSPSLPTTAGNLVPDASREAGAWHGAHSWETGYTGTAYGPGAGRGYDGGHINPYGTEASPSGSPAGSYYDTQAPAGLAGGNSIATPGGGREAWISAHGNQPARLAGFSRQVDPTKVPDRGMLAATGMAPEPQMSRITNAPAFDAWYRGNNVSPANPSAPSDPISGGPAMAGYLPTDPLAFNFGAGMPELGPGPGTPSPSPSSTPPPTPTPRPSPSPQRVATTHDAFTPTDYSRPRGEGDMFDNQHVLRTLKGFGRGIGRFIAGIDPYAAIR